MYECTYAIHTCKYGNRLNTHVRLPGTVKTTVSLDIYWERCRREGVCSQMKDERCRGVGSRREIDKVLAREHVIENG